MKFFLRQRAIPEGPGVFPATSRFAHSRANHTCQIIETAFLNLINFPPRDCDESGADLLRHAWGTGVGIWLVAPD